MNLANIKTLYDQDFVLWIDETVRQLKTGNLEAIDLENLIEEVESLGRSERRAVRSHLILLLEHLLKRRYVPMLDCYRGWEIEIQNFRRQLQLELEDSPSLKNFMGEILEKSFQMALKDLKDAYPDIHFPEIYPFSEDIDHLLTEKIWK